ncbi:MAG: phosphatidylglycerophosphatase A [Candidatus Eisenbacteria bacterium]
MPLRATGATGSTRFAGLARFVATFAYIGHLPLAPGTWAAAVTLAAWLLLPPVAWPLQIAIAIAGIVIGTSASGAVESYYGHDSRHVVIDEVAGAALAVAGFEPRIGIAIAGFLLFRLFDIAKPPPIYQLQALRGGVGVMADDVAAGILANVLIRIGMAAMGVGAA